MVANAKQLRFEDPREIAAEIDSQYVLRERLWGAIRGVVNEFGYETCAAELDRAWGTKGRPVSASFLRACLNDTERSNFRAEWLIYFARKSEAVADLVMEIAGRGRPEKKPEDELRDLKEVIRSEYPKQAAGLIRKGQTR